MTERVHPQVGAVIRALRDHRFSFANEADLQAGIADALTAEGVAFEREAVLSETERCDFLVGSLGVEVKTRGPAAGVIRQISRYLRLDQIDAVLLITSRTTLASAMPAELHGKPILTHLIGCGF